MKVENFPWNSSAQRSNQQKTDLKNRLIKTAINYMQNPDCLNFK